MSHQKFFVTQDVLEAGELAKLAYFNDIVVGAVCCRVDMQGAGRKVRFIKFINSNFLHFLSQLYIMTLGCLAPYRRLGIGTRMLEHVLNIVKEDGNYTSIFLHVQVILYLIFIVPEIWGMLKHSNT